MTACRHLAYSLTAAVTVVFCVASHAQVVPSSHELDKLFDDSGHVWSLTPDEFAAAQSANNFRWLSVITHDTARSTDPRLTFAGLRAWESLARFDAGTLKELTLSLYNRGDVGSLTEDSFLQLLASIDNAVTAWTGSNGTRFKGDERTTAIILMRKAWVKGPHRLDLLWSYTPENRGEGILVDRPEYIRLQITPFDPLNDPRHLIATSLQSRMKFLTLVDLRARVSRDPDGDVLIPSVPMVDQGPKGYCAAAVAERLLRYFGKDVDEHEIAQLANTSARGGTSPQAMVAALRAIGDQYGLDVTVQQDFTVGDFDMLIRNYNQAARSSQVPTIKLNLGEPLSLTQIYREMNTDLLRQSRLEDDGDLASFGKTVTKYIENGLPLAWSVMYGKIREIPPVRGLGGHIRLIIGYNGRTQEILYSDSWGAGHELKRLPLADAWTMTLGLYTLQPSDIRF